MLSSRFLIILPAADPPKSVTIRESSSDFDKSLPLLDDRVPTRGAADANSSLKTYEDCEPMARFCVPVTNLDRRISVGVWELAFSH